MFDPYKKIDKDKKCLCTPIIMGPTGPKGESDTITIGTTTTSPSNTKAKVIDTKKDNNHTLDFIIPMGPKGEDATLFIQSAYIVTFNDNFTSDGISIPSNQRLPLNRKEIDTNNIITLDEVNNTIKFNKIGYYKITFTISAYPEVTSLDFDPDTDIVSVGFRKTNTDNSYLGVGQWIFNGEATELTSQGIISVINTFDTYELVNLSKKTIYLNTPDIKNINTTSYFSNPLITLIIEYLGRENS